MTLPNVDAVELLGTDFRSQPMLSLGSGRFEAKLTLPSRVNRYRYKFKVREAILADPGNPLRQADSERLRAGNILWHPVAVHEAWLSGKIRRGRLERILVPYSHPTPHERAVWVHTPAGYEGRTKGLPALYLFHPGGGSGLTYSLDDCAPDLSDTLLSLGKVRPFMTVMPDLDPPLGSATANPLNLKEHGALWYVELRKRISVNASMLKAEVIPAVERKYGLSSDWRDRAIAGNSGGGIHTLMIEASNSQPYAKVLAPSAMFNSDVNENFFAAIDKRGSDAPRPKVIVSAGVNDPISIAGKAHNLGTVEEHCREFAALAEQRGMLHKMFIHDYGHSGGPEILVEVMEAAFGRTGNR